MTLAEEMEFLCDWWDEHGRGCVHDGLKVPGYLINDASLYVKFTDDNLAAWKAKPGYTLAHQSVFHSIRRLKNGIPVSTKSTGTGAGD